MKRNPSLCITNLTWGDWIRVWIQRGKVLRGGGSIPAEHAVRTVKVDITSGSCA